MKMQLAHNISSIKGQYPHTYQHHSQLLSKRERKEKLGEQNSKENMLRKRTVSVATSLGVFLSRNGGIMRQMGKSAPKEKQKSTNPAVIGQTEMDGGTIDQ